MPSSPTLSLVEFIFPSISADLDSPYVYNATEMVIPIASPDGRILTISSRIHGHQIQLTFFDCDLRGVRIGVVKSLLHKCKPTVPGEVITLVCHSFLCARQCK
jgi:hypothetical protein